MWIAHLFTWHMNYNTIEVQLHIADQWTSPSYTVTFTESDWCVTWRPAGCLSRESNHRSIIHCWLLHYDSNCMWGELNCSLKPWSDMFHRLIVQVVTLWRHIIVCNDIMLYLIEDNQLLKHNLILVLLHCSFIMMITIIV